MQTMLAALLRLQFIERQLAQVRSRLKSRQNASAAQQRRIDQVNSDYDALHLKAQTRQKDADRLNLDLKAGEENVSKYRTALNTAKTNKEYAAILTQINTLKADNAKVEDDVLKIMQEVDAVKAEAEKVKALAAVEGGRLAEIDKSNSQEIARLAAMKDDLSRQRAEAAAAVPPEALAVFERISISYDGEGMAMIEVHGKRPPHDYVCGGCYMSIAAEHANALKVRDEIRTCNNCGRILYLEPQVQGAKTD